APLGQDERISDFARKTRESAGSVVLAREGSLGSSRLELLDEPHDGVVASAPHVGEGGPHGVLDRVEIGRAPPLETGALGLECGGPFFDDSQHGGACTTRPGPPPFASPDAWPRVLLAQRW